MLAEQLHEGGIALGKWPMVFEQGTRRQVGTVGFHGAVRQFEQADHPAAGGVIDIAVITAADLDKALPTLGRRLLLTQQMVEEAPDITGHRRGWVVLQNQAKLGFRLLVAFDLVKDRYSTLLHSS